MASVTDMARAAITPDAVQAVSRATGESASAVQNTLNSAIPTILAGTVQQGAKPAGAAQLFSSITSSQIGSDPSKIIGSLTGTGAEETIRAGQNAVSQLFGNKLNGVTDVLARAGGVQRGSATKILAMATPIVMSVIGKQIASRNLDAGGLTKMLTGERDSITRALPAGMEHELGYEETTTTTTTREPARTTTTSTYHEAIKPKKKRSAAPYVLGALAALALLFFFTRDNGEEIVDVPAATEQAIRPVQPDAVILAERAGPITGLAVFLSDNAAGAAPRAFLVEGVTFDETSATLSTAATTALRSIGQTLAAHPNARVRIEAHTDSQGDAQANRQLSADRAEAVKQALVAGGASASQITTAGVGSERPVASNDTEAGRAQNRRVELIVTQR